MNYEERQVEGRLLGKGLDGWIDIIAPRGIRRWDLLSKFVDPPGVEFVLALSLWESSPSLETQSRLDAAHQNVIAAWERASAEFCAERSTF